MTRPKKAAATRTLSVRLPVAIADAVEVRAAARQISTSSFIADTLRGRARLEHPALAALGEVIALAHHLRADPANVEQLALLDTMIARLCVVVREELVG